MVEAERKRRYEEKRKFFTELMMRLLDGELDLDDD